MHLINKINYDSDVIVLIKWMQLIENNSMFNTVIFSIIGWTINLKITFCLETTKPT